MRKVILSLATILAMTFIGCKDNSTDTKVTRDKNITTSNSSSIEDMNITEGNFITTKYADGTETGYTCEIAGSCIVYVSKEDQYIEYTCKDGGCTETSAPQKLMELTTPTGPPPCAGTVLTSVECRDGICKISAIVDGFIIEYNCSGYECTHYVDRTL